MGLKEFSKKEAINFGWKTMKENMWFFIGLLITLLVFQFSLEKLADLSEQGGIVFKLIIRATTWLISIFLSIGLLKIILKFCDKEKAEFAALFSGSTLVVKYAIGIILYALIVFIGFILLIVPGFIWIVKFKYMPYLIIEKGMGPIEALKKSSEITNGVKWRLFIFGFVLGLINILGFLFLIIGLLFSIPTVLIADAFVYRKLIEQMETE